MISSRSLQHCDANRPCQVHCQGGKGRTGTFCASLMLWTGFCSTAADALEVYARRRTDPQLGRRRRLQGVDSPAQRRYLRYLERALHSDVRDAPIPPPVKRTLLTSVVLTSPPARRGSGGAPARVSFIVESMGTIQYDLAKRHGAAALPDPAESSGSQMKGRLDSELRFELGDGVLVAGDVTVRFFIYEDSFPVPPTVAELGPGARSVRYGTVTGRQFCFVTLHTAFHDDGPVIFRRDEIDCAYDKPESAFPAKFGITLTLDSRADVAGPDRSQQPRQGGRQVQRRPTKSAPVRGSRSPESPDAHRGDRAGYMSEEGGSTADWAESEEMRVAGLWFPYGLGVGRRRLRLHSAAEAVFASVCPNMITYRKGERMWCDNCGEQRLCLIVSGAAEYAPATSGESCPLINRGDSLARMQVPFPINLTSLSRIQVDCHEPRKPFGHLCHSLPG
jgi:hypothetical protein